LRHQGQWQAAWNLLESCDQEDYEVLHMKGIVAFYVQQFEQGKKALEKAIAKKDLPVDRSNLAFYSSF
jgi:hypothetical protein